MVHNQRLKEYEAEPESFDFTFTDRASGQHKIIHVPCGAMKLNPGCGFSKEMMNAACRALLHNSDKKFKQRNGAQGRLLLDSLEYSHRQAMEWLTTQTPPHSRYAWTFLPLCQEGSWSLLVVEHRSVLPYL